MKGEIRRDYKKEKLFMETAKYLKIPAIGQLDAMACWAACLKWWFRAAKHITKSQRKLIDKYNYLSDEYGGMQIPEIEQIIVDCNMYIEVHDNPRDFTAEVVAQRLSYGPLYVAYTETSSQKKHVNVIYAVSGTGASARVSVMEPQVTENADLTWKGAHQTKFLSEFNQHGSVHFGYK
jgi:Papain-like cysteine protease AvrRpt2